MEVIVARKAGFCFGVKRAVDTVYEQVDTGEKIYTYGPIIHNEEVVKDLEKKNVHVINSLEELAKLKEGTIVIRSHGVSKRIYEQIRQQGLKCVDATCPFVKRIHDTVEEESRKGCQIIIIGNAGHPEVEGIMGWCMEPAIVIESIEEAEKFRYQGDKKLCIVSQTTYNYNKFQDIVEIFEQKGYNVIVVNT
ncbi:MAG: 4-hydroxy-3-methylbut-2-enyl diphosphate reductase, partial [Lachnospiraceae bacterium]|nr:4-hydroxy-3-methylbut-2-enyl diphosphate reductase [Lachnospiraceae bacterium]